MAAGCYALRRGYGWVVDPDHEAAEVRRMAVRVSDIGADDAMALCTAGYALAYVCRDAEVGVPMMDRGLSLNPNIAFGWQCRGWTSVQLGQHEAALEQLGHSLRLNPLDPNIVFIKRGIAAAHMFLGRHEEAVRWAAECLAGQSDDVGTLRVAGAVYAVAGQLDVARRILAHMRKIEPATRLSHIRDRVPFQPADLERFLDGLRLAGLPE